MRLTCLLLALVLCASSTLAQTDNERIAITAAQIHAAGVDTMAVRSTTGQDTVLITARAATLGQAPEWVWISLPFGSTTGSRHLLSEQIARTLFRKGAEPASLDTAGAAILTMNRESYLDEAIDMKVSGVEVVIEDQPDSLGRAQQWRTVLRESVFQGRDRF